MRTHAMHRRVISYDVVKLHFLLRESHLLLSCVWLPHVRFSFAGADNSLGEAFQGEPVVYSSNEGYTPPGAGLPILRRIDNFFFTLSGRYASRSEPAT